MPRMAEEQGKVRRLVRPDRCQRAGAKEEVDSRQSCVIVGVLQKQLLRQAFKDWRALQEVCDFEQCRRYHTSSNRPTSKVSSSRDCTISPMACVQSYFVLRGARLQLVSCQWPFVDILEHEVKEAAEEEHCNRVVSWAADAPLAC